MKSHPEIIELDEADLRSKLQEIEAVLGVEIAQPFRHLLDGYLHLLDLLREKKISIGRLRKMVFGPSTEKTSKVLSSAKSSEQAEDSSAANAGASSGCQEETPRRATIKGRAAVPRGTVPLRVASGRAMAAFRRALTPAACKSS